MITAKAIVLYPWLVLLMAAFYSCQMPLIIENTTVTYPPYPVKTRPEKIVIANGYNADHAPIRDNKREQFGALVQETMSVLDGTLTQKFNTSVDIEPEVITSPAPSDSIVRILLTEHAATHCVTITHFDAFFDQTEVQVTETESGKEREAFYNMVVSVGYSWRSLNRERFDTVISVSKYHSSRSVLSGFLAGGPNIVKNDAEAREGVLANVNAYMRCLLQDSVLRPRLFYATNDFAKAGAAFKMMDYSKTMVELEGLLNRNDPKIAAKGHYNFAVLLERMGDYDEVKPYLLEALRLQPNLRAAKDMLMDYRHQQSGSF